MKQPRTLAFVLAIFIVASVWVLTPDSARADTLFTYGDQSPGTVDNGYGLNAPTANGCWYKQDVEEFGIYWGSAASDLGLTTQSACSSYAWSSSGYLGARFNGTAGSTTTTSAPTTTTTILSNLSPSGTQCTQKEVGVGVSCEDQLPAPTVANITSCNTGSDGQWCSPVFAGGEISTDGSYQTNPVQEWRLIIRGSSIKWRMSADTNPASIPSSSARTTGPICIAFLDGTYTAFAANMQVYPFQDSDTSIPRQVAYMFRPTYWDRQGFTGPSTGPRFLETEYAQQKCSDADPTESTDTRPEVDPPSLDCYREFFTDAGGKPAVRIKATVGNHVAGVNDEVKVRVPWESAPHTALMLESRLPTTGMPTGGWRGICTVRRTVNHTTHRTTNTWQEGLTSVNVGNDVFDNNDIASNPKPDEGFLTPPTGVPTLPFIVPPVGVPVPPGGVPTAPFVPAPPIISIPAAAYGGWTLGGLITGVVGTVTNRWTGNDEWYCRYNPGYRLVRQGYCDDIIEASKPLRRQAYLEDVFGEPVTITGTSPWFVGYVVAEVLINPLAPEVGRRTTVDLRPPNPDPEKEGVLVNSLTPEEGEKRWVDQQANPPQDEDPRDPESPPTEADPPLAPPPPSSEGNDCDQSFWSFLNPFNIASTMACFLKKLFIPDDGWDSLRSLWGEITSKVPFSYIKQAVLFIPTLFDQVAESAEDSSCADLLPNGLNDLPGVQDAPSIADKFGCPQNANSVLHPAAGFFTATRSIIIFLFCIGLALLVYNLIVWAL